MPEVKSWKCFPPRLSSNDTPGPTLREKYYSPPYVMNCAGNRERSEVKLTLYKKDARFAKIHTFLDNSESFHDEGRLLLFHESKEEGFILYKN